MNKNHRSRRQQALADHNKGHTSSKFEFGGHTQVIEIGNAPRKSKRGKVACKNNKAERQSDGEVAASY